MFQTKFPNVCPKPDGAVAPIPVTLHVDETFQVAVGIVPPFGW